MKPNTPALSPTRRAMVLLLALAPGLLSAQTAPAPTRGPIDPSRPRAEDEPIQLNEFRVDASKDVGYRATNSISATRLNTPIKDLPVPVEVITQDFINDIGALDVREALAYSSGIQQDNLFNSLSGGGSPFFTQSENANFGPNGTAFRLRGFTTQQALREGFRVTSSQDSIDISRVEVVRGPSALLYGVSFLGGVVNIIPKYPLAQPRNEVQATMGSFGLSRVAVDVNAPRLDLLHGVGNRVNLAYTRRGDWREFNDSEIKQFSHNISIKPLSWIETNLNLQYSDVKRTGIGPQTFTLTDAQFRNEYNEPLDIARSVGGKDNRFRWTGDDTFQSTESVLMYGVTNIRPFKHVTLNIGYQWTDAINKQRSINGLQLITSATPVANIPVTAYTNNTFGGTPGFQTLRWEWNDNRSRRNSAQVRTDVKFDFAFWKTKHDIIVGRLDIQNKSFEKLRGRDTSTPTQGYSYHSPRDFSYFQYDGAGTTPFRDSDFEEWNSGHYAIYSGTYLNRFNLLGGYRWDRYMVRQLQYTYANGLRPTDYDAASANQGVDFGRPDLAPVKAGYRFNGIPRKYEKPTYGLNIEITPEISAYVLSASGLFPNTGQRDGRGVNVNAEESESKEAGLKVDLWNGKISGTLSAFEIERENAIYFYSFAPSPRANRPERTGFDPRVPRSFGLPRTVVQAVAALNNLPSYVPVKPVTTFGSPATSNLPADASWVLNYETMRGRDSQPSRFGQTPAPDIEAKIMRESIESMLRGTLPNGQPLPGGIAASDFLNANGANWTGNSRGSDVEFDELAKGFDMQLQLKPVENWDVLLNYTNLERTISKGFEFVDFVDDGTQYGTEYDLWVNRMGGAQNFGDPLRASTFTGAVLVGLQIADVPKHSFSFFNNYTFRSGPLKDLSLRAGAIYSSKRPTAVAVTGQNLGVNQYPTPAAPGRATYNLGLGYRLKVGELDWRLNLAIDNILDDQKDEVVVRYSDAQGNPVLRRTSIYYTPISFRFTAGVVF